MKMTNFTDNLLGAIQNGDIKFLRSLLTKEIAESATKHPEHFITAFEKAKVPLTNKTPKGIIDAFLDNITNEELVHNIAVILAHKHDLLGEKGEAAISKLKGHHYKHHNMEGGYNDATPAAGGNPLGGILAMLSGGGGNSTGGAVVGALASTGSGAAGGGVVGAIAGAIGGISGIFSAHANRKAADANAAAAHEATRQAMYGAIAAVKGGKGSMGTGAIIGIVVVVVVVGTLIFVAMKPASAGVGLKAA